MKVKEELIWVHYQPPLPVDLESGDVPPKERLNLHAAIEKVRQDFEDEAITTARLSDGDTAEERGYYETFNKIYNHTFNHKGDETSYSFKFVCVDEKYLRPNVIISYEINNI
jgi:hypothetical protein